MEDNDWLQLEVGSASHLQLTPNTQSSRSFSPLLFDDTMYEPDQGKIPLPSNSVATPVPIAHAQLPTSAPPTLPQLSYPPTTDLHPSSVVPHFHAEQRVSSQYCAPSGPETWGPPAADSSSEIIDSLIMSSQGTQQSEAMGIPESKVFPGQCGFKVVFPASKYVSSSNTLALRPEEIFPAFFLFSVVPPSGNCSVRALVCCKYPEDIVRLGPCKRCRHHSSKDTTDPSSNHFLVCTNNRAVYGVHLSHKIVTTPLHALPAGEQGLMCLYKCMCHSTCVTGRSRNRPTLIVIFSLIQNGIEIGRDVVNLRSCANPTRASRRVKKMGRLARLSSASNRSSEECEKEPSFPIPPRPQDRYDNDSDVDEDGYYNFTWRGRERAIFDTLNLIKQGQSNGPQRE